ncbi:photosystem I chlorophyll a apoprotein A2 [Tanacetum coccineum]
MNSQLRQKQRRGGPRPGKGRVAEWSKAADCKSVEVFLRRFESCLSHLFVVDFREEKRGIRQRRKANRAKLLWPFREVQLYRMLVREVGELLRSIDSPSISNPNENRSDVVVGPTHPICSMIYGSTGATHFDQLAKILTGYEITGARSSGIFMGILSIAVGSLFKITAVPFRAAVGRTAAYRCIASMILGALAAMAQTKVKRLLAHSSIGHVGYIRTGFSCGTIEGIQALLIGIFIYASMTIDAFAIVSALRQSRVKYIADLGALAKTNPISAITFSITMFSYAGIPPLAGFCSKFYLFFAALGCGAYFLAPVGVVTSVIGRWAAGRLPRVNRVESDTSTVYSISLYESTITTRDEPWFGELKLALGVIGLPVTVRDRGRVEPREALLRGRSLAPLHSLQGSKPFFNIEGDGESGQNRLAFLIEQIQEKNHIENAPNPSPSFVEPCISVLTGSGKEEGLRHSLRRVLLLLMGGSTISYGPRHPRSNPLPSGWNCHNMGVLLSKNYCGRIMLGGFERHYGIKISKDPLHVRPIAHAIWDPHFCQPAVEAFTRGGALGPVNTAYSSVYQWWYTISLRTNEDLYTGALFLLFITAISLIAGLFGVSSLAWIGHLVHVVIPASRGEYVRWNNFLDVLPHPQGLGPLFTGRLGRGHKGLYDTIKNSIHFQLGLALASLGVITSLVAQHIFIMTGAFAHGAIFFIRDYNPEQNEDNVLARMLEHKEVIISHLSWASLFLDFHTLGLYVHNDVMLTFGTPEKPILIEPIFAQWIQSAHGKTSYGFDILLSSMNGPAFNAGRSIWLPGWLNAINENSNSLILTLGSLRAFWNDETLAWAHERTPLANLIRLRDKPVALSIVQARLDPTCIMDTNRNLTSMAKKSLIQREKKRQKLEQKYHLIRRSSKEEISKVRSLSDKWEIYGKLQSPPRNSAPTRLHRRCFSTGRPRANYRDFGLSGHILREMVHACLLPGATRSSW